MLVFTRYEKETIVIGNNDIVIKVLAVRDGRVRLGLDAASDITIHRGEVFASIKNSPGCGGRSVRPMILLPIHPDEDDEEENFNR